MNNSISHTDKVLVIVRNEQKGFYIALAKILAQHYKVTLLADNRPVARLIEQLLLDEDVEIILLPERRIEPPIPKDIVSLAVEKEKFYGEKFSFLLSGDRNLGRGYLTNIDRYVDSKRMWWNHERRLAYLVREITCYEKIFKNVGVVFMQYPESVPSLVCDAYQIQHFHLLPMKFGDYCFWGNDTYYSSDQYKSEIRSYLHDVRNTEDWAQTDDLEYEIDSGGSQVIDKISYGYRAAFKRMGNIIYRDTVNAVLGRRKPNSIRMYAWAGGGFRKVKNYRYVKKYGATPDVTKDYNVAYFPLQMEPELSLLLFSPEFVNTVEAIIWLAKGLPSNWLLVVKEQPNAFQFRSKSFYERFRQIGNVVLADPDTRGWDWIRASKLVATVTGTTGVEAVYLNRPVLSFGQHQVINELPTVFPVTNYSEVKESVEFIIGGNVNDSLLSLSRAALYNAQKKVSFKLPSFKNSYKTSSLESEAAAQAYKELQLRYPKAFIGKGQ
jgi:hypothetical protein